MSWLKLDAGVVFLRKLEGFKFESFYRAMQSITSTVISCRVRYEKLVIISTTEKYAYERSIDSVSRSP